MELGFAYYDPITNKVCIPEEQLRNILNFDKTCMSLDGSTQNLGGRPEVILYDARFPQVGKATSKSSLISTMITGCSAIIVSKIGFFDLVTRRTIVASGRDP